MPMLVMQVWHLRPNERGQKVQKKNKRQTKVFIVLFFTGFQLLLGQANAFTVTVHVCAKFYVLDFDQMLGLGRVI